MNQHLMFVAIVLAVLAVALVLLVIGSMWRDVQFRRAEVHVETTRINSDTQARLAKHSSDIESARMVHLVAANVTGLSSYERAKRNADSELLGKESDGAKVVPMHPAHTLRQAETDPPPESG